MYQGRRGQGRRGDVSFVLKYSLYYPKKGNKMARTTRKRSETGIYHIMLRGIDRREIFLDDEDRVKFIEKLMRAKETADFDLYGYCLMDKHVHLLIKENEEIGTSIKRQLR